MANKNIIVVVIGVGVALIAGIIGYNLGQAKGMQAMHNTMVDTEKNTVLPEDEKKIDHAQMTMEEMTQGLDGLQGDAFDKAFVEMMIVHHQGAVDMAKLIPANAKHAELKKLGTEIITAQTKEIEMMKGWLKTWGYADMPMMDHSMMKH